MCVVKLDSLVEFERVCTRSNLKRKRCGITRSRCRPASYLTPTRRRPRRFYPPIAFPASRPDPTARCFMTNLFPRCPPVMPTFSQPIPCYRPLQRKHSNSSHHHQPSPSRLQTTRRTSVDSNSRSSRRATISTSTVSTPTVSSISSTAVRRRAAMTTFTTSSLIRPCDGRVDRRLERTHGVDGRGKGHEVGRGAVCCL